MGFLKSLNLNYQSNPSRSGDKHSTTLNAALLCITIKIIICIYHNDCCTISVVAILSLTKGLCKTAYT